MSVKESVIYVNNMINSMTNKNGNCKANIISKKSCDSIEKEILTIWVKVIAIIQLIV